MTDREAYFRECIIEAADECGLAMTDAQADLLAQHVAGAAETVGMCFAEPSGGGRDPVADLKAELQRERDKVVCRPCGGTGVEAVAVGSSHVSRSQCPKCYGAGKVAP